jgi:hypothetical protein
MGFKVVAYTNISRRSHLLSLTQFSNRQFKPQGHRLGRSAKMQTQWQKTLLQISFWLIIEILLNLLGLDNLADYSEFVFEQKTIALSSCVSEVTLEI